jgi:hypothetical protein
MLDVSILILIFIFGLYTGFISKYNIAHHFAIKLIMIIGIIILQFIRDKYANIYTIALGTMLVIPYSSNLKECFEDAEDKSEAKKGKGDKEEPKKKKKKKKKAKDDDEEDDEEDDKDNKKSGGLFGGKKKKDEDDDEDDEDGKKKKKKKKKEKKAIIPKIPPKCAKQKIKILIPDNINVETEKMMTCKTMSDICFQILDTTKKNDMCSTMPKKSFSSSVKVDPLPANKKGQLTIDNCVHYLSQCIKDGDSVYPGESLCSNLAAAGSAGTGDTI